MSTADGIARLYPGETIQPYQTPEHVIEFTRAMIAQNERILQTNQECLGLLMRAQSTMVCTITSEK